MMRFALKTAALAACVFAAAPLSAQTAFPTKQIHLVVPATPAGTSDFLGRVMAPKLAEALGQNVVVENRAGAGTNIGNDYVAKAAPDGYTLLVGGITLATNSALFSKLPYDPIKDFAPIIGVGAMANVLAVKADSPIKTLPDFIEWAKKNPGKLNYGSPANGSSGHLSGELLSYLTGIKIVHLAYRGNAQAMTDLLGGSLQFGFVNTPVALPFVQDGKLRALAITSAKRSPLMPDVPTVAEVLNQPDYYLTGWFGLMAPAGTPPAVIDKIQKASAKILATPEMRKAIEANGAEVMGGTAAEFSEFVKSEEVRLTKVLKAAGIQPQ